MAKLLIVDSAAAPAADVLTLLRRIGHSVHHVVDGDEGLEHFRKDPADLVIADVVSGRGVAPLVRAALAEGDTRLLLTGDGPYLRHMAGALGVRQTLRKPYTAEQLGRAVLEALR